MKSFEDKLNSILLQVEKPARYVGGEWNTPNMNKPCKLRICYCFPDIYEIGMSNLGLQILYSIANKHSDFVAERCYAPWPDLAAKLVENNIPLLSVDTKIPIKDFDVLGFSMQFELLYTNLLYMLDLAQIPLLTKDRDESFPFIIAGGPCAVNPEPIADFCDLIIIGEGEEANILLFELITKCKQEGLAKLEILEKAKQIQGVYVPSLLKEGEIVKKAVVQDLEKSDYLDKPLVPNIEIIHDRATIELYRGCANGCRFCQAGFYYRPIRERSADRCVEMGRSMIENTGFSELGLSSLSTSDFTGLKELENKLKPFVDEKRITLALPSLRLSSFTSDMVSSSRRSSLTFAPEAGTQRLRNVINKNVSDLEIENIKHAFEVGYSSIKLYFMVGLPTETYEDLDGIVQICKKLRWIYYKVNQKKGLNISVSSAVFIPKPSTPFQWDAQISFEEMLSRQSYLRTKLREIKGVNFSWHGAENSVLEAVFARGDKKLSAVIKRAFELGAKFDSWSEFFNWNIWLKAFEDCNLKMEDYYGEINVNQPLCWDFIDIGVNKEYLLKERELAYSEVTTKSCRETCNNCGSLRLGRCSIL